MKLQKVEKLDEKVFSSSKISTRPFTSVIRFELNLLSWSALPSWPVILKKGDKVKPKTLTLHEFLSIDITKH